MTRMRFFAIGLMIVLAGEALALSPEKYEGHRVVVRRYVQTAADPAAFEGFPAEIRGGNVAIEASRLAGDGYLVIAGSDQTDEIVANAIGSRMFLFQFHGGKLIYYGRERSLEWKFIHESPREKPVHLAFLDAFGRPIPHAAVEVTLYPTRDELERGPTIARLVSDNNGAINLPGPEGGRFAVKVSHERYGIAYMHRIGGGNGSVYLPLMPADDEARERALKGRVVLPDGRPAAGALVTIHEVLSQSHGVFRLLPSMVLTDADGRFIAYPPTTPPNTDRRTMIPPGANYDFSVELQSEPRQFRVDFQRAGGAETEILLPRGNKLRHFAFEDQKGIITDPERLETAFVSYRGKDIVPGQAYRWPYIGEDHWLPAGTYSAQIGTIFGSVACKPVTIDDNTSDVVVFRPAETKNFSGRVIDDSTSEPLAGALVILRVPPISGSLKRRELTRAEWEALRAMPLAPDRENPGWKLINQMYGLAIVTRSDEAGRYEFELPPELKHHGALALAENYMQYDPGERPPLRRPQGEIHVYPSATLSVSIANRTKQDESFSVRYQFDEKTIREKSPDQKKSFYSWSQIPFNGALLKADAVTAETIRVPAGLPLTLVMSPRNHALRSIRIPVPGLSPGQHANAGAYEIQPAAFVMVQVVGPDDMPVEGVPVSCRVLEEDKIMHYSSHSDTDALGLAYMYVEPGTQGEFSIIKLEKGNHVVDVRVPYTCPEKVTDLPRHKLTLTGAQIAQLRKKSEW